MQHVLFLGFEQAFALGKLDDRLIDHILLVQAFSHVYASQCFQKVWVELLEVFELLDTSLVVLLAFHKHT